MLQTTSQPPSSSSAFALPLILNLEPSRVLWAWWILLHVLLGVACVLVGWPVAVRLLAIAAVVGHCIVRPPAAAPRIVHFAADGSFVVPEWKTGARPLGARTLVCPFWVRLDLGIGPWPRDILLIADQMRPDEWRRLRALLLRSSCD